MLLVIVICVYLKEVKLRIRHKTNDKVMKSKCQNAMKCATLSILNPGYVNLVTLGLPKN